jgi:hypothetical protein
MKPVLNTEVGNEITVGSKWIPRSGGRLSTLMGNIIIERLTKDRVFYVYDNSGIDMLFEVDPTHFQQFARRTQ